LFLPVRVVPVNFFVYHGAIITDVPPSDVPQFVGWDEQQPRRELHVLAQDDGFLITLDPC
jgi:hypothetical protein